MGGDETDGAAPQLLITCDISHRYEYKLEGTKPGDINESKILALETLVNEMLGLRSNLSSVSKFDPEEFLGTISKPFSVLGCHMISGLATRLGIDTTELPKFLGTIGYYTKCQGRYSQVARISILQFIHAQMSGSGSCEGHLATWARANPAHALALVIAALVVNNSKLRKRKSSSVKVERTKSAILNQSLLEFLSNTLFFQNMESGRKAQLLSLVRETLRATDPNMFNAMLVHEDDMMLADSDLQIMQSSILVAMHSHVFRKFKVHWAWSEGRIRDLENTLASSMFDFAFALDAKRIHCNEYKQVHGWFLDTEILPFVQMWVRVTGNNIKAHPLCLAIHRLGRTYEMLSDETAVNCVQSAPVRNATHQASLLQQQGTVESKRRLQDNEERSPVPGDAAIVLSVCKMYGIAGMETLFLDDCPPRTRTRATTV